MSSDQKIQEPHLAQIGMCTDDMPGSIDLFREVFGFLDTGGNFSIGPRVGKVQDIGPDAACMIHWMIDRQEYTQLEFFTHTRPRQRPIAPDWRPCDLGWVRWGFAVPDFEAALEAMQAKGIEPLTQPMTVDGLRRVCFRDPYVGTIVEVMEDGDALPCGVRETVNDARPAVTYATVSVQDLDVARKFYVDTLCLTEVDVDLHPPHTEELWGLKGASRETLLLRADGVLIEVVRYDEPIGRRHERKLSDQGMMNVAVGYRDRELIGQLYDRVERGGYRIMAPLSETSTAVTYVQDGEGNSVELLCVHPDFNTRVGFQQPQIPKLPGIDKPATA